MAMPPGSGGGGNRTEQQQGDLGSFVPAPLPSSPSTGAFPVPNPRRTLSSGLGRGVDAQEAAVNKPGSRRGRQTHRHPPASPRRPPASLRSLPSPKVHSTRPTPSPLYYTAANDADPKAVPPGVRPRSRGAAGQVAEEHLRPRVGLHGPRWVVGRPGLARGEASAVDGHHDAHGGKRMSYRVCSAALCPFLACTHLHATWPGQAAVVAPAWADHACALCAGVQLTDTCTASRRAWRLLLFMPWPAHASAWALRVAGRVKEP